MNIVHQQFAGHLRRPGKTGVDWFLFYYFLQLTKKGAAIEFGVGNGGSLFTMLEVNQNVTAVDDWNYNWKKSDVEQLVTQLQKSVRWIDKDTASLTAAELGTYSFVHLDANKSFEGTVKDLTLCNQIATGIVCVDDYMNSLWPEVTWAVDSWLALNPEWKRILVGNHQVFLCRNTVDIRELVVCLPLINRQDTWYISYGQFDSQLDPWIESGKFTYSWHKISTSTDKSDW